MATFEIDITIRCDVCGRTLHGEFDRHGDLQIEPCSKCLDNAENDGIEQGRAE